MTTDEQRLAELETMEERLDSEIAIRDEHFSNIYGKILDLSSDVDGYLGEFHFMAVQQTIDELQQIIDRIDISELLELALLSGIRTGRELPENPSEHVDAVPRLTYEQLPDTEDDAGDEGIWEDPLRVRVSYCADHIRRLFRYFEETWGTVTSAARAGDSYAVHNSLTNIRAIHEEAGNAYKMWEVCVAELYQESPGSLGWAGETLRDTERWLAARKHEGNTGEPSQ